MFTRGRTAVAVLVLATLSACTTSTTGSPAAPSTSAPTTTAAASPTGLPAATPSPTTAPPSVAALTKDVAHAKLTAVSAHTTVLDRSGLPPLDVCGGKIAAYAQVTAASTWDWIGGTTPIFKEGVFAFQSIPGSTVVAQAKALATSCKSKSSTLGVITTRTATSGPMSLHTPAGVDAFYAFCETHKITKPALLAGVSNYCTAVLSRGHLVVFLNAGGTPAGAVKSVIGRYLTQAAQALVKAIPAV